MLNMGSRMCCAAGQLIMRNCKFNYCAVMRIVDWTILARSRVCRCVNIDACALKITISTRRVGGQAGRREWLKNDGSVW